MWEKQIQRVAIAALDSVSQRVADAERSTDSALHRWLGAWSGLSKGEKEHFAEVVSAVVGTLFVAASALPKLGSKKKRRKAAKKIAKKALVAIEAESVKAGKELKKKAKKAKKK
jgi:hypothetical protein